MNPIVLAAAVTLVAAAAAALGAAALHGSRPPPRWLLGLANAVASGLMLGASYLLSELGSAWPPLATTAGAVAGIALIFGAHRAIGTAGLELNLIAVQKRGYSSRVYRATLVHAAVEGSAVGVAMSLELRLGVLMALALAVHNVAEGATLCAVLVGQGVRPTRAATCATVAQLPMVAAAVGAWLLVT